MTVECIGDSVECSEDMFDEIDSASWNGRFVEFENAGQYITQFYKIAQEKWAAIAQAEAKFHQYAILDLEDEPPADIEFEEYFESDLQFAPASLGDRTFSYADPHPFPTDIENCKSVFKRITKGTAKCGKAIAHGIKKGAKKTAKVAKKTIDSTLDCITDAAKGVAKLGHKAAHGVKKGVDATFDCVTHGAKEVAHFVHDHKKEIIIGAIIVTAVALAVIFGPEMLAAGKELAAAALAALGTKAAIPSPSPAPRRKEEDSPGTFSALANPPPKENTHFQNPLALFEKVQSTNPLRPSDAPFDIHYNPNKQAFSSQSTLNDYMNSFRSSIETLASDMSAQELQEVQTYLDPIFKSAGGKPEPKIGTPSQAPLTDFLDNMQSGLESIAGNLGRQGASEFQTHTIPPELASSPVVFPYQPFLNDSMQNGVPELRGISTPEREALKEQWDTLFKGKEGGTLSKLFFGSTDIESLKRGFETIVEYIGEAAAGAVRAAGPMTGLSNLVGAGEVVAEAYRQAGPMAGLSHIVASLASSEPQTSCHLQTEGFRRKDKAIGFINGMNTSASGSLHHGEHISKFANGMAVDIVYNHSNGFITDILEIMTFNYSGVAPITADLLIENWTKFHLENLDNLEAKYLQFAHSMGTIILEIALKKAPKEIRDRIIAVSLGTAKVISDDLCFKTYSYASENDFVHRGEDLHTYLTCMFIEADQQQKFLDDLSKGKEKLIRLQRHPDAKGILKWDHDCDSPTNNVPFKDHVEDYLEN